MAVWCRIKRPGAGKKRERFVPHAPAAGAAANRRRGSIRGDRLRRVVPPSRLRLSAGSAEPLHVLRAQRFDICHDDRHAAPHRRALDDGADCVPVPRASRQRRPRQVNRPFSPSRLANLSVTGMARRRPGAPAPCPRLQSRTEGRAVLDVSRALWLARRAVGLVVLFLLAHPIATSAQDAAAPSQEIRDALDRLRSELAALRQQYDARINALEARLSAVEGRPAASTSQAGEQPAAPAAPSPSAGQPPRVEVPAGATGVGGPEGALPVYGNTSALSKIFNPDVAVIGNFLGAAGTNRIDPVPPLQLNEAETSLQAIVDPYARADFFLAVGPEGIEIEEGFITFTSLPGGLLTKVGKMRGQFGKVNTMHAHTLPWVDRPLVMRNLVGGDEGISDAGISVSKLILNPVMFLEATGEVYRGESAVFTSHERNDLTYMARLRGYRDVSESSNIDVGTSFAYGHNQNGPGLTTQLFGVDATFRYRPLRRAIYRRLMARTELVWSRGEEVDATPTSFGMYSAADYQFARRWFAGVRYDNSERAFAPSLRDKGGSALLTFWPSEFSQVRGQYRRTRYAEGSTANEFLFQFLFSIGAHGAHTF